MCVCVCVYMCVCVCMYVCVCVCIHVCVCMCVFSELQRLVMEGIQAHISSPLEGVREVGMIVGEAYMNALHKSDHALKFDHTPSEEGAELVKLTR